MQIRLAVLAALILAAYGCATETKPAQPAAGAAAPAPSQSQSRVYRTGSRLPSTDDDAGSASVSGVSGDDYVRDRNATISPTRGN